MRSHIKLAEEYSSTGFISFSNDEINRFAKDVSAGALNTLQSRAIEETVKVNINSFNLDTKNMVRCDTDELFEVMLKYMELVSIKNGWDTNNIYIPDRSKDGGVVIYGNFYTDATVLNDYLEKRQARNLI